MARLFSSQEAKELTDKYRKLSQQLSKIVRSTEGYYTSAREKLHALAESGAFLRLCREELLMQEEKENARAQMGELIRTLYSCNLSSPVSAKGQELKELDKGVKTALMDLAPGQSGFQWLFTGKERKQRAEAAYLMLMELTNTDYARIIGNFTQLLKKIEQVSEAEAWQKFESDKDLFRLTAENTDGAFLKQKGAIPEIAELREKVAALKVGISGPADALDKNCKTIEEAAERCIAVKLLELLKDISVDELNRDKSGIRVKTLHDNGFDTMADIFTATRYQLESIQGISWDASFLIKQRAETYAEAAKKGLHLKLNADDKTPEAGSLVKEILLYKKRKALASEMESLRKPYASAITRAENALNQYENEFFWLFYPDERKQRVADAYAFFVDTLSSEFAGEVNRLSEAAKLVDASEEEAWEDFEKNTVHYISILEELVPGLLGNDDQIYGLPEDLAREVQEESLFPDGLNCSLRRYQEWGVKYALHQGNILLGDEMGLGKTIQAIATMVSLRNTGAKHFVVVCPASVLPNWCKEVGEKSKLRVTRIHGGDRKRALRSWLKTGGVAVTTFETTGFMELEEDFKFSLLIVDEAHYIKNPEARRTQNVKALSAHAERMLFMTGTALENKVDEMISLIDILNPEVANKVRKMAYLVSAPQFREAIAPVYYRRKREDVLSELPELIENREWVSLSLKERIVYEAHVYAKNFPGIRQVSWNASKDLKDSCKAQRMMEIIKEAEEEGRKIIVFSFFLNTIERIREYLGDRCSQPINGSVPPQRRQEIIDEFDQAPAGSVLLAQIQSGGTGLNIQSASVVILCEPQLKPSVEHQAISRAYRMGQSRNVLVYRLLCEDTIDERIMDILEQKQTYFDAFADHSVSGTETLDLDEKSMGDIIQEEIQHIQERKALEEELAAKGALAENEE
ncbi:MAG: DEAD/DEAH box helicase [Clostridiales bacterium]|nr:DEAD/DEAH box helicase [Candidatus Blautia equi]